jgi:transglutaminase-like putative cysteine protease
MGTRRAFAVVAVTVPLVVSGLSACVSATHSPATHATFSGTALSGSHTTGKKLKPGSPHRVSPPVTGTILLGGTMSTTHVMIATGALSISHLATLDWNLPLAHSVAVSGYSEKVDQSTFQFNVPPASSKDLAVGDNMVRRFHWDTPPANSVITVTETIHVAVTSDLSPFPAQDAYPLSPVSAAITPYLQSSRIVQLPAAASTLASTFAEGQSTERAVVESMTNWVVNHIHYQDRGSAQPIDATSVFTSHLANCEGYDDLMAGMLRQLHIPVQIVFGWASPQPLRLPAPDRRTSSIDWAGPRSGGALHTWLNVWFPSVGWVPLDPQGEIFFVDPHHIALFTNFDANGANIRTVPDDGSANAVWFGRVDGTVFNEGDRLFGPPLSNGGPESVPADGDTLSMVSLVSQDTLHVTYQGIRHDVTGGLLFSR